jgi:hypothetical protein
MYLFLLTRTADVMKHMEMYVFLYSWSAPPTTTCIHKGIKYLRTHLWVAYNSNVYFTVHTSLHQMFLKLTGQAHSAYNNT